MHKKNLVIFSILVVFSAFLVYAANGSFSDSTANNFTGEFNNTYYNNSGFIALNETIPGSSANYTITQNASELIGNESNLITYWRFNEDSWNSNFGEVKDFFGKNNGTARNGANTSAGKFNRSGLFDGSNDKVQIPNGAELNPGTGSFTITGWANSTQKGGSNQWQLYVAKRTTSGSNGYYVGMLEGSGLNFMVGDGTYRYDTRDGGYIAVNYNEWFHFAAVIDRANNQIRLYKNGVLGATKTFTTLNGINNTFNLSIGHDEGQSLVGYNYPVKGMVDEVSFWNKALNASEILQLYQKGNVSNQIITNGTNATEFYAGTYTSEVKDAGEIAQWNNLSWNEEVSYGDEEKTSDQVLLAHMNEQSGNIVDSSTYANDGTNNGATYNTAGKFNRAMSFDGANDYISFGNPAHLQITGNIALSVWVKFNQIPSGTTVYSIISKNEAGGYGIIANEASSGKLETYFHVGGAYRLSGISLSSLSSGVWYHLVGIYDGSEVALYVNGIKQPGVSATGSIASTAMPVLIGANPGPASNTEFFNGIIDEVSIWNRSLSSSEILSMYKKGVMNLKFQARASSSNPITSSFVGPDGTSDSYYTTSNQALSLSNSRYFQYKAFLDRETTLQNIKLYNITIDYTTLSGVSVSLDSPADNFITNSNTADITCSMSSSNELANVTAYSDSSEIETRSISGASNSSTFTITNMAEGSHSWNCYACDINSNCAFASSNRTILVDSTAPSISLVSPDNNNIENSTFSPVFKFNASDNLAQSLACQLLINSEVKSQNSSVIPGIETNLVPLPLENGDYTWEINCSDGLNSALSEERNITINKSSNYVPFWAKVNTHMHTTNSDGSDSPAVAVGSYRNKGYNILAVTDHNVVTNCAPFTNLSDNFLCVNSEEWTSGTKHLNRINISSHVTPVSDSAADIQNAFNTANNVNGFAIINHPNWSSTIWSSAFMASLDNYSSLEIYNKVIERLSPDPYAVKKWDELLKGGKKVFGIAADDSHNEGDRGFGWAKVFMQQFTSDAYVQAMKSGYFYSSQGPSMDEKPFTANCDSGSYHMGETANCTYSSVTLNATISASNSSAKIQNISLIKDGQVISVKTDCPTSQNCTFSYSMPQLSYYRLEAVDSNGKIIWSNPIWVMSN